MKRQLTNRLIHESSLYLRQHAHNPVDWYPWGEEALARARQEDKPILLSIGYSACHWCHVMEKECFENETIGFLSLHNNIILGISEKWDKNFEASGFSCLLFSLQVLANQQLLIRKIFSKSVSEKPLYTEK